jgi:uncharacterized protein YdaU (DUF1376 family)
MHHYPHHIGDYRTHTAHLTMIEDGAYRRLLDIYYMNENSLPADVVAVQRIVSARSKSEREAVETVLREFFTLQADGWHQSRADEEIAIYREKAEIARKNGRGGGRPKADRTKPRANPEQTQTKPAGLSVGFQNETQNEPSGKLTENRKPVTVNQEPEETERGAPPLDAAVTIWNDAADRVGWPKVQRITDARRKALAARLADCGGIDGWTSAVAKAESSSFLTGRTGRTGEHANWRCDIDFVLRLEKFTKLMEGGFDDHRTSSPNGIQSGHERQRQALAEWSREGDR